MTTRDPLCPGHASNVAFCVCAALAKARAEERERKIGLAIRTLKGAEQAISEAVWRLEQKMEQESATAPGDEKNTGAASVAAAQVEHREQAASTAGTSFPAEERSNAGSSAAPSQQREEVPEYPYYCHENIVYVGGSSIPVADCHDPHEAMRVVAELNHLRKCSDRAAEVGEVSEEMIQAAKEVLRGRDWGVGSGCHEDLRAALEAALRVGRKT